MSGRQAVVIDWPRDVLNLYFIADTHVGSAACREDAIQRLAAIVQADEYALVIGGGDYCEAIAPSDRRYDPRELAHPVAPEQIDNLFYCQALRFAKLMEPTRGKWAGLILGNHEHTAANKYFTNQAAIIADRLGTRYVGGSDQCGWFRIRWKRVNGRTRALTTIFVIHGWGGGELRGGDALKMQRLLWRKDCDLLLMGHTHRPMIFPETVESVDKAGVVQAQTRFGVIGYPLVGQHGYIARRGGNPAPTGYVCVRMYYRAARNVEMSIEQHSI
jgi:predicted phosphodiesterase